jgi:hypothetical protein
MALPNNKQNPLSFFKFKQFNSIFPIRTFFPYEGFLGGGVVAGTVWTRLRTTEGSKLAKIQ